MVLPHVTNSSHESVANLPETTGTVLGVIHVHPSESDDRCENAMDSRVRASHATSLAEGAGASRSSHNDAAEAPGSPVTVVFAPINVTLATTNKPRAASDVRFDRCVAVIGLAVGVVAAIAGVVSAVAVFVT